MKDFDWVIGKRVGELTILSYTPPLKNYDTKEIVLVYAVVGSRSKKG